MQDRKTTMNFNSLIALFLPRGYITFIPVSSTNLVVYVLVINILVIVMFFAADHFLKSQNIAFYNKICTFFEEIEFIWFFAEIRVNFHKLYS